jgi:DHA2 family multidrug resistance protein
MQEAKTYPDSRTQLLITISALTAVILVTLDSTIATIALTRIQSTLAASPEQITWVITSYLIAAAVMTPLAGWLADRFGRIRVMEVSVFFFTLSSLGCGLAPNLEMLVLFRFIQGAAGAGLVPLSQILLIEIYPPEKHGPAIAAFGIGTLVGPMLGPTVGAWLIEYISWRWIFLINVPIGALSLIGFALFASDHIKNIAHKFDLKGFFLISTTLTTGQLALDRGQLLDWFSSTEVSIEVALAILFFYLSLVHVFTTKNPFIKPAIFRDRNFALGTAISALVGIFLVGAMPIITNFMQQLLGFPVLTTGLVSLPRAIGNVCTVLIAGQIAGKVDPRVPIVTGMCLMLSGFWMLSQADLNTSQTTIALVSLMQGLGSGLLFLPLMLLVFTTLPEKYKNEGATLFSLMRNVGGAVGVSVIQTMTLRDMATTQSYLVERVRPDDPLVTMRLPEFDITAPLSVAGEVGKIAQQAAMVAYTHTFQAMLIGGALMIPLCLAMKIGKPGSAGKKPQMMIIE